MSTTPTAQEIAAAIDWLNLYLDADPLPEQGALFDDAFAEGHAGNATYAAIRALDLREAEEMTTGDDILMRPDQETELTAEEVWADEIAAIAEQADWGSIPADLAGLFAKSEPCPWDSPRGEAPWGDL
ncbi:hypothetical protein [Nocardia sp. NPDC020380]|uniref:hypothetical protein n=1 Tax=Nocardia sp. NPDC020380 TaxID=3364309 RepID=UPI0037ACDFE8